MAPRTRRRGGATRAAAGVVRRHRPDYQILLYMGILMLLGLVMMYAIGPQRANVLNGVFGGDGYSDSYFFIRQLISIGTGLIAFTAMALIPYKLILRYAKVVLYVGIGACIVLAIAAALQLGIATETYGATRWFNLGPLGSLQPSEILKFGILLYLGIFLGIKAQAGKLHDFKETLLPAGLIMGIAVLFIVVIQRDLGTGISLFAIVATMLIMAGINARIGFMLLGLAVAAGIVLVLIAPHRVARFSTFLQGDNTSTETGASYHAEHAKIAIGTGGLFGVGIGNSVQATGYLPEAINDSVFAIMGEIFGFVGLILIMALYVALTLRLLRVSEHMVDIRLKLIAAGVFGWFGAHTILNIGAMIGFVPLTGITLPLLSLGGTSMVFIAAALGLVFQLSGYTVHDIRRKEEAHEDSRSRRGLGRTRYASRSRT